MCWVLSVLWRNLKLLSSGNVCPGSPGSVTRAPFLTPEPRVDAPDSVRLRLRDSEGPVWWWPESEPGVGYLHIYVKYVDVLQEDKRDSNRHVYSRRKFLDCWWQTRGCLHCEDWLDGGAGSQATRGDCDQVSPTCHPPPPGHVTRVPCHVRV